MSLRGRLRRFAPLLPLGMMVVVGTGLGLAGYDRTDPTKALMPLWAPQIRSAFQTMDKLAVLVSLPPGRDRGKAGVLRLELIGPAGRVLERAEQVLPANADAAGHRFELRSPRQPVGQLVLRCRFGGEQSEVPLAKVLVGRAHETVLSAGEEFYAGSPAAIRCEVHGVRSALETEPLSGAAVEVRLHSSDGKTHELFKGKTGDDGAADARFRVPALAAGKYQLEVFTRSEFGEEKLQRAVNVRVEPKVLLVSDKPLYQPGQVMHLRALALWPFDLRPVENADLLFEIEDAKGNKVFKDFLQTSNHGIATVDFQLADEVNEGAYRVRAILGERTAEKTVTVKRYVLPKFKADLAADKPYYLPGELIHADLQADYFFGKPVAGARVAVTASAFDTAFKDFLTWEGKTDAAGHVRFEARVPHSLAAHPPDKGNGLVRLEAKVTDTADHVETIIQTFPVSARSLVVSLIPEGGRLVPGLENRVFVAALYPDGSPAKCNVSLWTGKAAGGKPFATVKTNEAGLAEWRWTPLPEQLREERKARAVLDLFVEARDAKGSTAKMTAALSSDPPGANLLLRLDKAIYKGGEALLADVLSTADLDTAYLDVVRDGQTLVTKRLEVKNGRGVYKLELPANVFGSLEIHASQVRADGEILRDARVVYVQPPQELTIKVKSDKEVYAPGAEGSLRFEVTDGAGRPAAAALGVIVVDEAVYALQEMQPGLEKVYFTLQDELLQPRGQGLYKPGETLDELVREPELADTRQQVARALLAAARPKPPAKRWEENPLRERRRQIDQRVAQIGWAVFDYAFDGRPLQERDPITNALRLRPDLLSRVVQAGYLTAADLNDPYLGKLTLDAVTRLEKGINRDNLIPAVTRERIRLLSGLLVWVSERHARDKWLREGKWTIPDAGLVAAIQSVGLDEVWLKDGWGNPFRLERHVKKRDNPTGFRQLDHHEIVSAGPDGQFGTADDVRLPLTEWDYQPVWWLGPEARSGAAQVKRRSVVYERINARIAAASMPPGGMAGLGGGLGGFGGGLGGIGGLGGLGGIGGLGGLGGLGGGGGFPMAPPPVRGALPPRVTASPPNEPAANEPAQPARLREYFPETMLWQPSLITDDKGVAVMPVTFADSITTWRLTASASSSTGLLGGTSAPLQVFQTFFVDLDLPLHLTQGDEVAFPVAVYNYRTTSQTVTLDLQKEDWFELADSGGFRRSLDIKPGEVLSVKFRIRAKRFGNFPLTVKAQGSKAFDAIKRTIEVVPNGRKVEQVVNDRLTGRATQIITIPENAVPGASGLFVKIYPGIFGEVLEGVEGLLRVPSG